MLPLDDSGNKLQELPNWYTDVIPFHLPNDIIVPELIKSNPPAITSDKLCMDQLWLINKSNSSWALFPSQVETSKLPQYQDLLAMLPIWWDDSKSPATIKHLLTVLMETINYLNSGQTAVAGLDQPLYAIAKWIQWLLPNEYGHRKVVLMLSALYIEMVMLGCLGDLLEDSGWTVALSNSGITSPGNGALLTGHVVKTKYMHQVTALALHQLMVSSYDNFI